LDDNEDRRIEHSATAAKPLTLVSEALKLQQIDDRRYPVPREFIMRTAERCLQLFVRSLSARSTRGILQVGAVSVPCALGRTGRRVTKREGDGATPIGRWPVRAAWFRRDRLMRPRSGLALRRLTRNQGWCDEPGDRNYNRAVTHPYPAGAERLWRDDGLYDVVVVLGYNDRRRVRGKGSAIFLHCARADLAPTQGCIALRRADLVRLLPRLSSRTTLVIA
jgi:L,D-peptidoglycan transpeptidase YkuD (ErfK/YbiS/YcfS/YnhG family)